MRTPLTPLAPPIAPPLLRSDSDSVASPLPITAAVPLCVQSIVAPFNESFLPPRSTSCASSAPESGALEVPIKRRPPFPVLPTRALIRPSSPLSMVNCCPTTAPTPMVAPGFAGIS